MPILILFHRSNYRCFKYFFLREVLKNLAYLFPNLVGYSQFIRLTQEAFFPMFCFTQEHLGVGSGISFIDSTVLTSCHVKRASSHKTFKKQAKWGKTTTGWFFGFKLHLVINHQSEIIAFISPSTKPPMSILPVSIVRREVSPWILRTGSRRQR